MDRTKGRNSRNVRGVQEVMFVVKRVMEGWRISEMVGRADIVVVMRVTPELLEK